MSLTANPNPALPGPGFAPLMRAPRSGPGGVRDRNRHVFRDWFPVREPARADHRPARAQPSDPPDGAAARSRDSALDGRDPGRQGPAAGRIRDLDAAAGADRGAAQGPLDRPTERAQQEE